MRKTLYLIISLSLVLQIIPLGARASITSDFQQRREDAKRLREERRAEFEKQIQQKRDLLLKEFELKRGQVDVKFQQQLQDFLNRRQILQQELQIKEKEFEDQTNTRQEELTKKFGKNKAAKIESFFNQMQDKFDVEIRKLNTSADNLEFQIGGAAANGKDVAAAREKLLAARGKIMDAEKNLADAKTKYTEATQDRNFNTSFQEVHKIVGDAVLNMKDAHQTLVEIINILRGEGGGEINMGTTTSNISSTSSQFNNK